MKHIPVRMCVACRNMKPQGELIRFVKNGGLPVIDFEKKKFGRGAYICRSAECIKKAEKKNLLAKHFKCNIDKEIYMAAEDMI